jgi:hypothetical protein
MPAEGIGVMQDSLFTSAIRRLHREKGVAYGDSWKKRGELISIIANIARKVDRLEMLAGGATATRDESLMDTAVDLFVYTIMYQTFLADQDPAVARHLFGAETTGGSYSDGVEGFERLVARTDVSPVVAADGPSVTESVRSVLTVFGDLEACFRDLGAPAPASVRAEVAGRLTAAAAGLLGAVHREAPDQFAAFTTQWVRPSTGPARRTRSVRPGALARGHLVERPSDDG